MPAIQGSQPAGGGGGTGDVTDAELTAAVDGLRDTLRAGAPTNADTFNEISSALDVLTAAVAALPVFGSTTDVVADLVTTPGSALFNLGDNPSTNALDIANHAKLTSVRLATLVALPACTYSNGSSGVGATLTGDANGALADIDYVTPVAGDRILVKNQAAALQNGVYVVTTLGTAGTPFVLTRIPEADVAADWVDGVTCMVGAGLVLRGSVWHAAGTITMGTTAIPWHGLPRPSFTPTDAYFGPGRDRRRYIADFEELVTAITANGSLIPGTSQSIFLTGTSAQATQQHSGTGTEATSMGVLALETGTQASGAAGLTLGRNPGYALSPSARARLSARWHTSTVATSGVEDFNCWIGFLTFTIGANPTDCIAFKLPAGGGNIQAVTRSAGTETATDTGQAQATSYKVGAIILDEVAGEVRFYLSVAGVMTLVATNTTNIPTANMSPGALIDKTAGTTMRDLRLDFMSADGPDARTAMALML